MNETQLKEIIVRVRRNLRVTKVVATRSVKTSKRGDFFCGFSAAWNTVQDDTGGPGADTDLMVSTAEVSQSGMTMQEARVAHLLVALQADIGAYEAAYANRGMSLPEMQDAIKAVKHNYGVLIQEALTKNGS